MYQSVMVYLIAGELVLLAGARLWATRPGVWSYFVAAMVVLPFWLPLFLVGAVLGAANRRSRRG